MPNEMWQSDFTHWTLADGTDVEILTFLDDRSRFALSVTAHNPITGRVVLEVFRATISVYGPPASTLTDNGMVFTTRYATGKGGRNAFETELANLGIIQKNSRPNHPTTVGKVERFQQTLKKWLSSQPLAASIEKLQTHLDEFTQIYNQQRPHTSLGDKTPTNIYNQLPKATPTGQTNPHYRVRHDIVGKTGTVSLRHNGRLYHIGIGRAHTGTTITLPIADLDIRIITTETGELLRHPTLNPNQPYQPQKQENP